VSRSAVRILSLLLHIAQLKKPRMDRPSQAGKLSSLTSDKMKAVASLEMRFRG
jgi:hypothetical protein